MARPGWIAVLSSIVASLALAGRAAAGPACPDQLVALDKWLATAKVDVANGATIAGRPDRLVAIPLKKSTEPQLPAMEILVDKDGLHDALGPARPVRDADAMIDANHTIEFARSNKSAITRGIFVAATRDAPAASVRAAVIAAVASGEKVWLVFRPSDMKLKAPPASPITKELAQIGPRDAAKLVKIITREFGPCEALMEIMQNLGDATHAEKLTALLDEPGPAVKKCQCKPSADRVASILWTLVFRDLSTLLEVATKDVTALPWGGAKATWADIAPAVLKALGR
jgi:hypothetical protein